MTDYDEDFQSTMNSTFPKEMNSTHERISGRYIYIMKKVAEKRRERENDIYVYRKCLSTSMCLCACVRVKCRMVMQN